MPSQRLRRVQNLLRAEISTVLLRRTKDPRISMVTLTAVEAAPDLKTARVYISVYGDQEHQEEVMRGLASAAPFIRSELMKVLDLRPMPALEFLLDEALARATYTLDLLDRVLHEERTPPPPAPREPGDPATREQ